MIIIHLVPDGQSTKTTIVGTAITNAHNHSHENSLQAIVFMFVIIEAVYTI